MKINLLLFALLISATSFAQDTTEKVIKMPVRVAREIQIDLIQKDSIEAMLGYAITEVDILNDKLLRKDSTIAGYSKNFLDLTTELNNEKALKLTYKGIADDCKTDYDKLGKRFAFYRKKATFGGILLSGIAIGLASVILIKL